MTGAVNERFAPIRSRRAVLARHPGYLRAVLTEGNRRAAVIAAGTLTDVRTLMHTSY